MVYPAEGGVLASARMGEYDRGRVLAALGREILDGVRVAVETGTCQGAGTRALAAQFAEVHSIELSAALFLATRRALRAEGLDHVRLHQGDSAQLLRAIATHVSRDPCLYFLDAHWSGDATVDWGRSPAWRGYGVDTAHRGPAGRAPTAAEQVPLLDELRAVARHHDARAVLAIDDYALLDEAGRGGRDRGFPGCDWTGIDADAMRECLGDRVRQWVVREGQLFVELSPRS